MSFFLNSESFNVVQSEGKDTKNQGVVEKTPSPRPSPDVSSPEQRRGGNNNKIHTARTHFTRRLLNLSVKSAF